MNSNSILLVNLYESSIRFIYSSAVGKLNDHSALDRRSWVRVSPGETPPCKLTAPSACKICRGSDVLQVLMQIIPLGVPKQESHPLRGRSKLLWHVSGTSLGMSPRPWALAHCINSSPTLNPTNTTQPIPIHLLYS